MLTRQSPAPQKTMPSRDAVNTRRMRLRVEHACRVTANVVTGRRRALENNDNTVTGTRSSAPTTSHHVLGVTVRASLLHSRLLSSPVHTSIAIDTRVTHCCDVRMARRQNVSAALQTDVTTFDQDVAVLLMLSSPLPATFSPHPALLQVLAQTHLLEETWKGRSASFCCPLPPLTPAVCSPPSPPFSYSTRHFLT